MNADTSLNLWVYSQAGVPDDPVAQALTAAGVHLLRYDGDERQLPGLILVDHVDSNLLTLVRNLAANGTSRLLAATRSPSAVVQGRIWEVLNAGPSHALPYTPTGLFSFQI